jgi:dGTPase
MARSIARALRLDEDLAEAVALAHDLGHTPFGHAGERMLHEKMAAWGGFDHNLQALRVVTELESRYAEHDGLNLTWETLEGILKHNGPVLANPPGLDLEPHTHAGLEAQVAAIADDIAYDAHDIDDALRAGLIKLDDLADVPLVGPIVREVQGRWPILERRRFAHEVQRRLITRMIEDVIAATEVAIADANPQSVEDVRALDRTLVTFSSGVAAAEHALKRFMFERVYRSEPVMELVRCAETLLGELFDAYMRGAPLTGRWSAAVASAPGEAARARIICDYIAGMTDPFAEERHAALVGRTQ